MKTTLEIPDDLMREVKHWAIEENRRLKDMVADLLRSGLEQRRAGPSTIRNRVKLPLIQGGHSARPEEEMTPERLAALLIDQEAEWHLDLTR
jgi:hypothetical protein